MCKAALALDGTHKNLYSLPEGRNQEQRPLLLQMDDKACAVPSSNARRFNTQSMPLQRCLSSPSAHMSMLLSDADFLGLVVMLPCPRRASARDHRDVRGSRSDSVQAQPDTGALYHQGRNMWDELTKPTLEINSKQTWVNSQMMQRDGPISAQCCGGLRAHPASPLWSTLRPRDVGFEPRWSGSWLRN